jgi:hypothetical protein
MHAADHDALRDELDARANLFREALRRRMEALATERDELRRREQHVAEEIERLRRLDEQMGEAPWRVPDSSIAAFARPAVDVVPGIEEAAHEVQPRVQRDDEPLNGHRPPAVADRRPTRVALALYNAGGTLKTSTLVRKLLHEMDDPYDQGEDKFWRIVDSILRRGRKFGYFKKGEGAEWSLTPAGEDYYLKDKSIRTTNDQTNGPRRLITSRD